MTPLLSVKNVTKTFPAGRGKNGKKARVHAVNNISFDIYPGETFSVVGESGCGKSTIGRLVDHLLVPDSGESGLTAAIFPSCPTRRCAPFARIFR